MQKGKRKVSAYSLYEMILDSAQTVLGLFGFDRTVHSSGNGNFYKKNKGRRRNKWYEELREERRQSGRSSTKIYVCVTIIKV